MNAHFGRMYIGIFIYRKCVLHVCGTVLFHWLELQKNRAIVNVRVRENITGTGTFFALAVFATHCSYESDRRKLWKGAVTAH